MAGQKRTGAVLNSICFYIGTAVFPFAACGERIGQRGGKNLGSAAHRAAKPGWIPVQLTHTDFGRYHIIRRSVILLRKTRY